MIVDSNIAIDYLRGKEEAIHFLEGPLGPFAISAVSITELYAGIRNREELIEVEKFLESFTIHPVDEEIAKKAGDYLKQYAKSHDFGIADALIAATSTLHGEQIATRNVKDFPMLDVFKPY
jgi:predicted nucleic acid-binding protein